MGISIPFFLPYSVSYSFIVSFLKFCEIRYLAGSDFRHIPFTNTVHKIFKKPLAYIFFVQSKQHHKLTCLADLSAVLFVYYCLLVQLELHVSTEYRPRHMWIAFIVAFWHVSIMNILWIHNRTGSFHILCPLSLLLFAFFLISGGCIKLWILEL